MIYFHFSRPALIIGSQGYKNKEKRRLACDKSLLIFSFQTVIMAGDMISKKQILTILSGFMVAGTVGCHELDVFAEDSKLYARSIWDYFWPENNAKAAESKIPPRPPKPKKVHRKPPVYTIDSAIKSTTNLEVRRYQIDILVPDKTPIYQLRYVFQNVLDGYEKDADVIWMEVYKESQKEQKSQVYARAQWFRSSVPRYLRYRTIELKSEDEIFHKIYIKYNAPGQKVPHYK